MPGTRPDKKELAQMKALQEIGITPTAIARKMGRSHHTIIKYLDSGVFNAPDIRSLVNQIKEKEIDDLYLLGAKARKRLHTLLDKDDTKAIETTAVMDRAFQQRRLLEGQSTQIVETYHDVSDRLKALEADEQRLMSELVEIEKEKRNTIDVTPGPKGGR